MEFRYLKEEGGWPNWHLFLFSNGKRETIFIGVQVEHSTLGFGNKSILSRRIVKKAVQIGGESWQQCPTVRRNLRIVSNYCVFPSVIAEIYCFWLVNHRWLFVERHCYQINRGRAGSIANHRVVQRREILKSNVVYLRVFLKMKWLVLKRVFRVEKQIILLKSLFYSRKSRRKYFYTKTLLLHENWH